MSWTPLTSTTYPLIRDRYVSEQLIAPPVIEPIDLDEFKKHIRFGSIAEDTLADGYIAHGREEVESMTGRQLLGATWEQRLEGFNGPIELPHPPLLEVLSIKYDDGDGVEQTLDPSAYVVDAPSGPHAARGIIEPAYSTSWPSARSARGSVRIQYRAGYGEQPGNVPQQLKGAVGFLAAYFHQFRSAVYATTPGTSLEKLPFGHEQIILAYKLSAKPRLGPQRVTWG